MSVTAVISHIARASLHDGPGVRTVVYFKGCALRCAWCHNPETLSAVPEVLFAASRCIGCGRCAALCPTCHLPDGTFDRAACTACGRCAAVCPSEALTVSGKTETVDSVMAEIMKDAHYYSQNGGVTLSGGECLLQADFAAALLAQCRERGIHTAIETALFVPWGQVEKVWPLCDKVFADLKLADSDRHALYTGHPNARILENLRRLAAALPERVTVRIPLIPGVNTREEDTAAFARALAPCAPQLAGVELLRYNTLAAGKYAVAGRPYTDFGAAQTDDAMRAHCFALEEALGHTVAVFTAI